MISRITIVTLLVSACVMTCSHDPRVQAQAQVEKSAAPMPPAEAARTMIVPDGFRVTLFAGEPDVQQPIGFCLDDRGRLWVAEAYNYPFKNRPPADRIIILEDTDGDGRFDNRTVFCEGLTYVTGIEVGFGGVWVMSPPNFYFIPDQNGDDKPDGEPVVLLDGFGIHANSHNLANGFSWGPDGWLYGTHGRTNWSMIGKPGTPESERTRFDGGVYRYHPVRHVWEPFADGTTNPWGIDWDDYGQGFVCNCVDPHLFHVIQGAHYEPWRNRESSRFAYERIATIADHFHFAGTKSVLGGAKTDEEDEAGGGHAHCGTMVYLGDSWPEKYRNTVFMHNLHGHRINNDILRRVGSGYTASHGHDLLRAKDSWYMGVTLQYGPDGAVFSSDWNDTGECHSMVNTQRGTGRIFKISYGETKAQKVDLKRMSDHELVSLQSHHNDWFVRPARRLLQERAALGQDMAATATELKRLLGKNPAEPLVARRLRWIWALNAIGFADDNLLTGLLDDSSEYVRAWSIRLLSDKPETFLLAQDRLNKLAKTDSSPFVSLHLASALQRLPLHDRWSLAAGLSSRAEFEDDANIPLLIWYGIEPLVHENLSRFVELAIGSEIPLVRKLASRRVAAMSDNREGTKLLVNALTKEESVDRQRQFLEGILKGIEGTRSLVMPDPWPAVSTRLRASTDESVREQSVRLSLIFNDPIAIQSLVELSLNKTAKAIDRQRAISALVAKHVDGFDVQLITLIDDPATQSTSLKGLAEYNHPQTVAAILEVFPKTGATERQDAIQTLAARPTWAKSLLDAVEADKISRAELTAFTARQIHSLGDKLLSARVEKLWGQIRETSKDKARLIAGLKQRLTADTIKAGDRRIGREIFAKTCANCHRLFGAGTPIGPDLTGAQRTNIDYLLLNLIDPSASISKDFQMQVIEKADGRIITGLVIAESENAMTIQTANEKVVVPLNEIEHRVASGVSMMPEGLLQRLKPDEVRDLFAYLTGSSQAPAREGTP